MIFNNSINSLKLDIDLIKKIDNYKFSIVLDGIGATYPGYINKNIANMEVIKCINNDIRAEKNIAWEQWFSTEKYIEHFPLYIKSYTNIYYLKYLENDKAFINDKKEINITINYKSIEDYFIFMNKYWMNNMNEYNEIEVKSTVVNDNYLDISLSHLCKNNDMKIDDLYNEQIYDYTNIIDNEQYLTVNFN
jgi:hypothetical protein